MSSTPAGGPTKELDARQRRLPPAGRHRLGHGRRPLRPGVGEGWEEDTRYREDAGAGYRSKVWREGDFSAGIALVDGRPPAVGPALIVLVSEKD